MRDMGKPMGIAGHRLGRGLPEQFEGQLPSVEELEAELVSSLDQGVEE